MKKSKVIIPAMAMILFSTAASISGTVAWFTASRVFDTEIANFTVKSIDGNLLADMGAGVGTTQGAADTDGNHPSVTVNANSYLIDASFNHVAAGEGNALGLHAFRKSRDVAGTYDDKGAYNDASVATKWTYRVISSNTYYIAYSWTIQFKYSFNAESEPVDIFLDVAESSMTATATNTAAASGTLETSKGFRIAFINGGHNLVWGDLADSTSQNSRTVEATTTSYWNYVKSTTTLGDYTPAATAADSSKDFIHSGTTEASKAEDETTVGGNTNRANKIATIAVPENPATTPGTVTVTCVAWYEGTDPNVVNNSAMQTCKASMSFYARSKKST